MQVEEGAKEPQGELLESARVLVSVPRLGLLLASVPGLLPLLESLK